MFRAINSFFLSGLILSLSFSGCHPVKGYPGPELPENQISLINLAYDSQWVTVNEAGLDGLEFGFSGITVLPGNHFFQLNVSVKDPPHSCYAYPQMNRYGYNKCLKKHGPAGCNCWDYLSVYQRCFRQVYDGICEGKLTTNAGAKYSINVYKRANQAEAQATQQTPYVEVGQANCRMHGSRIQEDNSYVGSGISSAYRYGIYGCY